MRSHAATMLAVTGAQLLIMVLVVLAIHIVLYFYNRIESCFQWLAILTIATL